MNEQTIREAQDRRRKRREAELANPTWPPKEDLQSYPKRCPQCGERVNRRVDTNVTHVWCDNWHVWKEYMPPIDLLFLEKMQVLYIQNQVV